MTIKSRLIIFALVSALLTAVAGTSGYWIKSNMADAMRNSGITPNSRQMSLPHVPGPYRAPSHPLSM